MLSTPRGINTERQPQWSSGQSSDYHSCRVVRSWESSRRRQYSGKNRNSHSPAPSFSLSFPSPGWIKIYQPFTTVAWEPNYESFVQILYVFFFCIFQNLSHELVLLHDEVPPGPRAPEHPTHCACLPSSPRNLSQVNTHRRATPVRSCGCATDHNHPMAAGNTHLSRVLEGRSQSDTVPPESLLPGLLQLLEAACIP